MNVERRHVRALQTSILLSAVLIVLVLGTEYLRDARMISNTDRSQIWLLIANIVAVLGLQAFLQFVLLRLQGVAKKCFALAMLQRPYLFSL